MDAAARVIGHGGYLGAMWFLAISWFVSVLLALPVVFLRSLAVGPDLGLRAVMRLQAATALVFSSVATVHPESLAGSGRLVAVSWATQLGYALLFLRSIPMLVHVRPIERRWCKVSLSAVLLLSLLPDLLWRLWPQTNDPTGSFFDVLVLSWRNRSRGSTEFTSLC